jgi:hypothetical protein
MMADLKRNKLKEKEMAAINKKYDDFNNYQELANKFLQNNLTLNDNVEGVPIEYSEDLYAKVPNTLINNSIPLNIPPSTRCDVIDAVNISGWDDYGYAEV